MNLKLYGILSGFLLLAVPTACGCSMDWVMASNLQEDPPVELACETDETNAQYTVRFQSTWSEETHPVSFPSGPHFSGLIGATHGASMNLWKPAGMASAGIENMAETGGKSPLDAEINGYILVGDAEYLLSGGGINPSPGAVSLDFEISAEFPLVSLVSMIAPSPDWFVGVDSLALCDENGWAEELIVDLYGWDAGTDSGPNYRSPNSDTNPEEPISALSGALFVVDGETPSLGTYTFTRDLSEESEM
jgi:hypothetical protein